MNIGKEIKYCDILMWVTFGLMLAVRFLTMFSFSIIHQDTAVEIETIAKAYEGNELVRIAMSLDKIGTIITLLIMPASAMAFYYFMRRRVKVGKADLQALTFFVQFAFFALLINIVNDGAVLLGKILV